MAPFRCFVILALLACSLRFAAAEDSERADNSGALAGDTHSRVERHGGWCYCCWFPCSPPTPANPPVPASCRVHAPPDAVWECSAVAGTSSWTPNEIITGYAVYDVTCPPHITTLPIYHEDVFMGGGCSPGTGVLERRWFSSASIPDDVQTITVQDTLPPVISPLVTTVGCVESPGVNAVDVCQGPVTPTIIVLTAIPGPGECGVYTRSVSASDSCGNDDTIVQTVTVVDLVKPIIVVTTEEVDCGDDTHPDEVGYPLVIDACTSDAELMWSDTITTDFPAQVANPQRRVLIERVWTTEDNCFNAATPTTQSIFIVDDVPPRPIVSNEMQLPCDAGGCGSFVGPFTVDDCPYSQPVDESFVVSSSTRTCGANNCARQDIISWQSTDDAMNTAAGSLTLTVLDNSAPVFETDLEDHEVECGRAGDILSELSSNPPVVTDTCEDDLVATYTDESLSSCGSTVRIRRRWDGTDGCGNSVFQYQTIEEIDTTPPQIQPPIGAQLDCASADTSPLFTGTATAFDACSPPGTVQVTYKDGVQSGCGGWPIISRLWTATDACRNENQAAQYIAVLDTLDPVVTAPGPITVECGDSTDPSATGTATAVDNCASQLQITYQDYPLSESTCFSSFRREWRAYDGCNSGFESQTITIQDARPATVTPPPPITVECGSSLDPSVTGQATVMDICNLNSMGSYIDGPAVDIGSCKMTITRSWSGSDACNVGSAEVQVITLEDTSDPVINVPADEVHECVSPLTVPVPTVTIADTCDPTVPTALPAPVESIVVGSCGSSKTAHVMTRTWSGADWCGNAAQATQTIQFRDTTPPLISVPMDVSVECGDSTNPAQTGRATAVDACVGDSEIEISFRDRVERECGLSSIITRTWLAQDRCGNRAEGIQTITVLDTTPPDFLPFTGTHILECGESSDPEDVEALEATDACSRRSPDVSYRDVIVRKCGATKTIERTWTARDECGHRTSATQTIDTFDNVAPEFTFFPPHHVTLPCNGDQSESALGRPTARDGCSATVAISSTDVEHEVMCTGTAKFKRRWTAVDACGQIATRDQTIATLDVVPPVITDTVVGTQYFECDTTSPLDTSLPPPMLTDDCTLAPVLNTIVTVTPGSCHPAAYSERRTLQAVDDCGNTAVKIRSIEIRDTLPPVITMPPDVIVECGADTSTASQGTATAFDQCAGGLATLYVDDVVAGCGGTTTTRRTWGAIDTCGNADGDTQTIAVVDTTPPVFDPLDVNISVGCNDDTTPEVLGFATASDVCGSAVVSFRDLIQPGCGSTKTITREWNARDGCSNTAVLAQTISVVDADDPVFVYFPEDVTVECGGDTTPDSTGEPEAEDNCVGLPPVEYSDLFAPNPCNPNVGVISREWSVCDACSNCISRVQLITVEDSTSPELDMPRDITVTCDIDPVPTQTGVAGAFDSCSPVTVTHSDSTTASCPQSRDIERTWTATDSCGNSVALVQQIQVVDLAEPLFTFIPQSRVVECGESIAPDAAVAIDNCSSASDISIVVDTTDEIVCGGAVIRTHVYTATDECGNTATATQTLRSVDTTAPEVDFPADATVNCLQSTQPDDIGTPTPSIPTDPCNGVVEFTSTDTSASLCGGATRRIFRDWVATDECGNSIAHRQEITVEATPLSLAVSDIAFECDYSTADFSPSALGSTPTVTADCVDPNVVFTDGAVTSACGAERTWTRTWTATDSCGQESQAVQQISFSDTLPPTVTAPGSVTVECGVPLLPSTTGAATVADLCDSNVEATFFDTFTAGMCGGAGTVQRSWSAVDECGFAASAALQIIEVQDTTPPEIQIPQSMTVECGSDTSSAALGVASATDVCSTSTVDESDVVTNTCGNSMVIERTWTAVDDCMNSIDGVQVINVVDSTPPDVAFPGHIVVSCGDPTDPSSTGEPSGISDDCSASWAVGHTDEVVAGCHSTSFIERSWEVVDLCGNVASFVQTITVESTISPVLVLAPADSMVDVECGTFDEVNEPTAVDECTGVSLEPLSSDTTASRDCRIDGELSLTIRAWNVADNCGNVAESLLQTIATVDTLSPVLIENSFVNSVECGVGSTLASEIGVPVFQDQCSSISLASVDVFDADPACASVGQLSRTWTATDECNHEADVTQLITITDTNPPDLQIPPNVEVECGDSTDPLDTGYATASDLCSEASVAFSDNVSPTCGGAMTILRTWRAEDVCGLWAEAVQTILVVDTTAPELIAPIVPFVECGDYDLSDGVDVAATDACSAVDVTYTEVFNPFDCENGVAGEVVRSWTAIDDCGLATVEVQTVVVIDTNPPALTAPEDVELECGSSVLPGGAAGLATAVDVCSGPLTLTNSRLEFVDLDTPRCGGTVDIQRLWTATDSCGLASTAVQYVSSIDTIPPIWRSEELSAAVSMGCLDFVEARDETEVNDPFLFARDVCEGVAEDNRGESSILVTYVDEGYEDNKCLREQSFAREWKSTDSCGNVNVFRQSVVLTVSGVAPGENEEYDDGTFGDGMSEEDMDDMDPAVAAGATPTVILDCSGMGSFQQVSCLIEDTEVDSSSPTVAEVTVDGKVVASVAVGGQGEGSQLRVTRSSLMVDSTIADTSVVVDIKVQSGTGDNQGLQGNARICLQVSDDLVQTDEDLCLGFFDEESGDWECADECVDSPQEPEELVCGSAAHFTNFAVLTGASVDGGISGCGDDSFYITGSWTGDMILVFCLLAGVCCCMLFIGLIVPKLPFGDRLIYGKEGLRLRKLRMDKIDQKIGDDEFGEECDEFNP